MGGELGTVVDVSIGTDEPFGGIDEPPVESVGTTTWANVGELPKNKDKPRLLRNALHSSFDDIIILRWKLGKNLVSLIDESFAF